MKVFFLEADDVEQLEDPLPGCASAQPFVNPQRFADNLADGHAPVERGGRRLVDHLHLGAFAAQIAAR